MGSSSKNEKQTQIDIIVDPAAFFGDLSYSGDWPRFLSQLIQIGEVFTPADDG